MGEFTFGFVYSVGGIFGFIFDLILGYLWLVFFKVVGFTFVFGVFLTVFFVFRNFQELIG